MERQTGTGRNGNAREIKEKILSLENELSMNRAPPSTGWEPHSTGWEPLSVSEAYHLIRTGQAGHYSAAAETPLAHNAQTCVYAEGQWYLVPATILMVVCLGPGVDNYGDETTMFGVTGQEDHPVFAAIKRDADQYAVDFFACLAAMVKYSTHTPAVNKQEDDKQEDDKQEDDKQEDDKQEDEKAH